MGNCGKRAFIGSKAWIVNMDSNVNIQLYRFRYFHGVESCLKKWLFLILSKIRLIFYNLNFHCPIPIIPPLADILSQANPVHIFYLNLFKKCFVFELPSTNRCLNWPLFTGFTNKTSIVPKYVIFYRLWMHLISFSWC